MRKITYTPEPQLLKHVPLSPSQTTEATLENMNVFEKVFFHINEFIEGCKEFGQSWGDFWSDPLGNISDFILDGIDGLATCLTNNVEIFILAGIIGAYFLMHGKEELGKKIISGAMWALLIAKVVAAYI